MKYQIIADGKYAGEFDADEIFNHKNAVTGTKDGKIVAVVSKSNVTAVIPTE